MKTFLVTGGAGFIGSWLCENLLKMGKVICLDNLVTGNKENISHLMSNDNFVFKNIDVSKKIDIKEDVDHIYHLASPASPIDYYKLPLETILVNSLGTLNMLEIAKGKNASFLLASTSEVYGDPKEHPQKETYWGAVSTTGPRSCYYESKRFAETLTYFYYKKYGFDAKIVRIFNTYGPRNRKDDGRVVPNFISQAINNENISIYGSGSQTRSFCYVEDMIKGIIDVSLSKYSGEIFNIGNPEETKVKDLADKIISLTNSNSKIIYKDLPQDDPVRRKPDISKIKSLLKWEPKIGLEKGLKNTIEYYRNL